MKNRALFALFLEVARQLAVLLFVKASGLVSTLVLSRTLGVAGLGTWAGMSAIAAMLSVVGGLGVYHAIIQYFPAAENDGERGTILRSAAVLVFACTTALALVGAGAGVLARAAGWHDLPGWMITLTGGLAVCMALRLLLLNAFRAQGRLRAYSLATIVCELAELVACVGAALWLRSVVAVAAATCLVLFGSCIVLFGVTLRELAGPRGHGGWMNRLLRYGLPVAGTQLADTVLARSDRVLVAGALGGAAAGVYAATYALVSVPVVLSTAVTTVMFPRLASRFWDAKDATRARRASIVGYAVTAISLLVLLTVASRRLLEAVLGEPAPADTPLSLLFFLTGAGVCLFGAARIFAVELFVANKTGRTAVVWVLGAGLNVGLNLYLLPKLGLIGAGLANFLSYLGFFAVIRWAAGMAQSKAPRQ